MSSEKPEKPSRYIPDTLKMLLWGKAAGRCEYDGCNKRLWKDDLTLTEYNIADIAHMVAHSPDGERGDEILSFELKAAESNLMLLCGECHRRIDRDVAGHPIDRLREMKVTHERRIELLTGIAPEKKSTVLLYGSKVGLQDSPLSYKKARQAMVPEWYPADDQPIDLGMKNAAFTDHESEFWKIEVQNLRYQFNARVKERIQQGDINHLSVFGFADQPLLMELGRLLSDIPPVEVYQLHREPQEWGWLDGAANIKFKVVPGDANHSVVALNLSLSARITNDRITAVLGDDCSIWTMTISRPDKYFLKSRHQLQQFREDFSYLLDCIHAQHGDGIEVHVFPAVPVAIAVEIGRVRSPKADLPLRVYDQNRALGGFKFALEIAQEAVGVR